MVKLWSMYNAYCVEEEEKQREAVRVQKVVDDLLVTKNQKLSSYTRSLYPNSSEPRNYDDHYGGGHNNCSTPTLSVVVETNQDEYFRNANLQQVIAMLVEGVYSRDSGSIKHIPELKTYRVDERAEIYTKHDLFWTRMDNTDEELEIEKEVGLRHYLRDDRIHQPCGGAPRLVIAIRGTKKNSFQDVRDDKRIASHTLHKSRRFQKCQELTKKLIQKFEQNYNDRRSDVFIAGHSLGAAIALAIGTDLAALKQPYAVHCFNPPLVTDNSSHIVSTVRQVLDVANNLMFRTDVKKVCAIDESKIVNERCRFGSLADWEPVLYVNKHDFICNEYYSFYEQNQGKNVEYPYCKRLWVGYHNGAIDEDRMCNVVPTVCMHISMREDRPHDLKQWYADDALRKPVEKRYQLEVMQPDQYVGFQHSRRETSTDIHASDIGRNYGISRRLSGRLHRRYLARMVKASNGHTNSRIVRFVKFVTGNVTNL